MKEFNEILKQLNSRMPNAPRLANHEASLWQNFVENIPVGTNVVSTIGSSTDVRKTLDGRYYDDANDLYINVTDGGVWSVKSIRRA